jgi:putative NADH-flavin reductase
MHITVFGANFPLGERVVHQCLNRGFTVTAFSRNIEGFIDEDHRNELLIAKKGYILDANDVSEGLLHSDAVIVLFNNDHFEFTDKSRSIGIKNIIAQMGSKNISRVVVLGGMGILNAENEHLLMDSTEFPEKFKAISEEQLKAFELLSKSSLNWTYYCPSKIINADETGHFITSENYLPDATVPSIHAGDLALSMIESITKNQFVRCRVGIANI